MAFRFRKLDCPRLSLSAELDVSTQTVNRGLDRKARVAVIVAVALLIAVPVYLIIKLATAQLRAPERQQVLHPQEGQLVTLRDGSTMAQQQAYRTEARKRPAVPKQHAKIVPFGLDRAMVEEVEQAAGGYPVLRIA